MSSRTPTPGGSDLTGRVLADRYRLNRVIAAGGMATVWEASDQLLARRVAVKILHPHLAVDESFVRRFRGEAVAAARLAHPSIVSVFDTVTEGDVNAIVMELVSGTTLRADIDEHGPLQMNALLAIGTQVADALGAAHDSGLVHRDVKPANILLSADGRVLVTDFGIAKAAQGADLTEAGSMVGTAKYLSPEQVMGAPVDARSDLYSLGIVLYEAVTGRVPWVADNDVGTALARVQRDPVPIRSLRPETPVGIEQVINRAMARDPGDRFPNAAAMRRSLLAAGADPSRAPMAARAAVANATSPIGAPRPSSVRGPQPGGTHLSSGTAPTRHPSPPSPPRPPAPQGAPSHPSPMPVAPRSVMGAAERPEPVKRTRRRGTLWAGVAALLVVAAGVAAFLLLRDDGDGGGAAPGGTLDIASVTDFDPLDPAGEHKENPDLLPNLIDDDPTTLWMTQSYSDPSISKGGVGFIVELDSTAEISSVALQTPVGGWDASVYVSEGDVPDDLDGWGDPVGSVSDAPEGLLEVELTPTRGKAALVWFTELAPIRTNWYAAQISDVTVSGR